MAIHYCFIAKDSDMIIFEAQPDKEMSHAQLKNEALEILIKAESKRDDYACSTLERISGPKSVECHLAFKTLFFGIVTDLRYEEEKAKKVLAALHEEMEKMYKGRLDFIERQQNLKPNVYDKVFKPNFQKVYYNYNTGISSTNLNAAFDKVEEVKNIAARSVDKMNSNLSETQKLLESSQEVSLLAKDFEKNSIELESVMKA